MTKKILTFLLIIIFLSEITVFSILVFHDYDLTQDAVAVNEVFRSVQADWDAMEKHKNITDLDYVVLDKNGNVLFRTRDGLSESLHQAITHGDGILDVESGGAIAGRIIIRNNGAQLLQAGYRRTALGLGLLMLAQWILCIALYFYLNHILVKPFQKLKSFAQHIARGNLDIPLEMDKHNLFGAFTESFDLMRSELKKARKAEAKAAADKKELVAKLSHDIRTPLASIKAASEVGIALADSRVTLCTAMEQTAHAGHISEADSLTHPSAPQAKSNFSSADSACQTYADPLQTKAAPSYADHVLLTNHQTCPLRFLQLEAKKNYGQIKKKADQINALVTELFTATLEELQQLPVNPTDLASGELKLFLENADYLHRGTIPPIPDCLLYGDRLRLQQVFDNIFANSYKYAGTPIETEIYRAGSRLSVCIEDHGGGVSPEDLPLLKEKFRRGSNTENIDGAGLGLYISDFFMREMKGDLTVENGLHGLKVTVSIPLSGTV